MVFKDYASYYDLIYKDKEYEAESEYIVRLLNRLSPQKIETILDLGCGTGNHDAVLSRMGYRVTGVDISENMIDVARLKQNDSLHFHIGDIRKIELNRKFDAIISLFHVASYQTSNEDLIGYLSTINNHLKNGGVFIFDFWYGPAVLTERPSVKVKRLENDELQLLRIAEPELLSDANLVNVNYEVFIERKSTSERYIIDEVHSMRYLFIPELIFMINSVGLIESQSDVVFEEWLTGAKQTERSWGVVCAGIKK